jgi:hypothetical protein
MSLGKLLKNIAPIAISAFAGPAIGSGIGQLFGSSAVSPFISRALTGAVTSKLMGGKNKDALRNALLSGIGGMAIDKFSGAEQAAGDVAGRADQIARNRMTDPMAQRNGGIDPSEGSGKKDDVPAMLMAGEFVLTKDAVRGLGDGNQRKGIQRAYNMMDQLEARA